MKNQYKLIVITFITLSFLLINCNVVSLPNVSASDPTIGVDVSEDGILKTESLLIHGDVQIIYFQFFLNAPDKMEIVLDYKWYQGKKLFYAYSGTHTKGSVTATLERNSELLEKFPPGYYSVEVWFLNTLLTSKTFQIQE